MKDLLKKDQVFKFVKVDKYDRLCGKLIGTGANAYVDFDNLSFQNSSTIHLSWTEYGQDGWQRKREDAFDIRADENLLFQSWKVIETAFGGGSGDAQGHNSGYPDGHHVTARTLDGKHTVTFFQSGSFIGMQRPEKIELLEDDSLSSLDTSDEWNLIEEAINVALEANDKYMTIRPRQASLLLRWAKRAREQTKLQEK